MSKTSIDYTNKFILSALKLPIITNLDSLSNHLGLSKRIVYVLSKKSKNYYRRFYLEKKNGTRRTIHSPSYSMKLVQRWILKEILEKLPVSELAMAYKKGNNSGIKSNAEIHKNNLYLLELDLKDFFPSIKRDKVYFLFKNLGYNSLISNIFANFCTLDGRLPQGGVCSPYISNLLCTKLDNRIKTLCAKRDITYTRYADDLTFSCDNKAILNKNLELIKKIISDEGFSINNSKTRFLSPVSHKIVTGLTVNDGAVKANKTIKKKVRAMIHKALVTKDYSENDKIIGYISFIDSIETGYKDKVLEYINKIIKKQNYRAFQDIVDEFNKNILFKNGIEPMEYEDLQLYENEFDEVFTDIAAEREMYLSRFSKSE